MQEFLRRTSAMEGTFEQVESTMTKSAIEQPNPDFRRSNEGREVHIEEVRHDESLSLPPLDERVRNTAQVETLHERSNHITNCSLDLEETTDCWSEAYPKNPRTLASTFSANRRSYPESYVQGLLPLTTMVTPFSIVVDYRSYRLNNKTQAII